MTKLLPRDDEVSSGLICYWVEDVVAHVTVVVCLFNKKHCENKGKTNFWLKYGAGCSSLSVAAWQCKGEWRIRVGTGVYLKLFPSNTELRGRPAVSTRYFHTECQPNDGENYPRWCWGWITVRPKRSQCWHLEKHLQEHIVLNKIMKL